MTSITPDTPLPIDQDTLNGYGFPDRFAADLTLAFSALIGISEQFAEMAVKDTGNSAIASRVAAGIAFPLLGATGERKLSTADARRFGDLLSAAGGALIAYATEMVAQHAPDKTATKARPLADELKAGLAAESPRGGDNKWTETQAATWAIFDALTETQAAAYLAATRN